MNTKLSKLGAALYEESYDWLLRENPEVLVAVEDEVRAGKTAEQIGDFVTMQIGPDRMPFVRRVVLAAKHLITHQN